MFSILIPYLITHVYLVKWNIMRRGVCMPMIEVIRSTNIDKEIANLKVKKIAIARRLT